MCLTNSSPRRGEKGVWKEAKGETWLRGGGWVLCTLLLKRIISFIIIWNQDHHLLAGPAASGSVAHSRAAGLSHTSLESKQRRTAKSCFICLNRTGFREGVLPQQRLSTAHSDNPELETAHFQGLKNDPLNPDFFFFFETE